MLCSLGFSTPNGCSFHAKAAVAVVAATATATAAEIAVVDAETTTFQRPQRSPPPSQQQVIPQSPLPPLPLPPPPQSLHQRGIRLTSRSRPRKDPTLKPQRMSRRRLQALWRSQLRKVGAHYRRTREAIALVKLVGTRRVWEPTQGA